VKRLAILPLVVIAAVVAVPFVLGDQPLRWGGGCQDGAALLPSPGSAAVTTPASATSTSEVDPYPVSKVARPWRKGMPQLGIHVYWEAVPGETQTQDWLWAQRSVNYAVSLNSNSISVSFPFYTPGIHSAALLAKSKTPPVNSIAILVHEARLAGLRITLRPILDEKSLDPPTGWRGNIEPVSTSAWFSSYRKLFTPYLEMAQRDHVDTVVLGVELNSMEPRSGWRSLIRTSRAIYTGELAYNANWDRYLTAKSFPDVDQLGVDAYFPVKLPDTASAGQIGASWNRWLNQRRHGPLKDTLLSEVGIGSRRGAFRSPGNFYASGRYDARVQPTWYRAVCAVAQERKTAGIYFWKTNFGADLTAAAPNSKGNLDFTGHTRSEQAIQSCFAGWAAG
jgi:hypothetical protein